MKLHLIWDHFNPVPKTPGAKGVEHCKECGMELKPELYETNGICWVCDDEIHALERMRINHEPDPAIPFMIAAATFFVVVATYQIARNPQFFVGMWRALWS